MKSLKKIWHKVSRQRTIPAIGGFKDVLAQTSLWIATINFVLIGMTAYSTTVRPHINYDWFTLPIFMLFLICLIGFIMIVEYKFIIPSYYVFRGKQYYKHESQMKDDLKGLEDKMERLQAALDEMVKRYN